MTVAERFPLLELLVFDAELRDAILPLLEPSDYENLATGELFEAINSMHGEGGEIAAEELMGHVMDDDILTNLAQKLFAGKRAESMDDALKEAENCVFSLRDMAISNRITEINRGAASAEATGDTELANQLTFEQLELEKIRREVRRRIAQV